jgi:hypothetical protein
MVKDFQRAILILIAFALTGCTNTRQVSSLPSRIDIQGHDFPVRLEFTGTNRSLSILLQNPYGDFVPTEPPIQKYDLKLLICDDNAVGLLVGYRLIWWSEYKYEMEQAPTTVRETATSVIALSNRILDDTKTLHPPMPFSDWSCNIDSTNVTSLEDAWKAFF